MVFSPKCKITVGEGIKIANLKRVTGLKYLGVHVDSKLSFGKHLKNLIQKLSQRISALRRQATSLPTTHIKRFADAAVNLYLYYCSSAWLKAVSAAQIKQLQRQQNIKIRMIVRDAGKKVGQGGRQEQKGTYHLRPTNISQKWRASEAFSGEYNGLCLSQSYK